MHLQCKIRKQDVQRISKVLNTRLTPVHTGRPLVNRTRFWGRAMVSTFLMAAIGPGGGRHTLCRTLPFNFTQFGRLEKGMEVERNKCDKVW